MRIFVTALIVALALTSSAFAGNVALSSLGATAVCDGTPTPCQLGSFPAGLTIDGIATNADEWVAPGGTLNPGVLVNLGQQYTIDSITITGFGNVGNEIQFEIFVGTNPTLSTTNTGVGTLVPGSLTTQVAPPGGAWSDTFAVSTSSPIQYILYDVTGSFGINTDHQAGWDDALANEISADSPAPEPGTFALIGGAGMLLLGFARRRFQS